MYQLENFEEVGIYSYTASLFVFLIMQNSASGGGKRILFSYRAVDGEQRSCCKITKLFVMNGSYRFA